MFVEQKTSEGSKRDRTDERTNLLACTPILLFFRTVSISSVAPRLAIVENDLPNDTIEHLTFVPVPSNASPTALTPPTSHRHRSILDVLDENSPTTEFIRSASNTISLSGEQLNASPISHEKSDGSISTLPETRSNIASSIGPATSSPSPTSTRQYRPLSLTSTQAYFKTIQQPRASSPNSQHVQTIIHPDADLPLSRTSSMKHGEKRETVATVRFVGTDENRSKAEETYL